MTGLPISNSGVPYKLILTANQVWRQPPIFPHTSVSEGTAFRGARISAASCDAAQPPGNLIKGRDHLSTRLFSRSFLSIEISFSRR